VVVRTRPKSQPRLVAFIAAPSIFFINHRINARKAPGFAADAANRGQQLDQMASFVGISNTSNNEVQSGKKKLGQRSPFFRTTSPDVPQGIASST
jgi:hypothetical protein